MAGTLVAGQWLNHPTPGIPGTISPASLG